MRHLFSLLVLTLAVGCGDPSSATNPDDVGAADTGTADSSTDLPPDGPYTQCGGAVCISSSAEGYSEDPVRAATVENPELAALPVCVYSRGLTGAAEVYASGTLMVASRAGDRLCFQPTDLADRTPDSEVWIVLGEDADNDSAIDPGTGVESNHLPLVTPPWIDSLSAASTTPGEELVVTGGNFGNGSELIASGAGSGCLPVVVDTTATTATVVLEGVSGESACSVRLEKRATGQQYSGTLDFDLEPAVWRGCINYAGGVCGIAGAGFGFVNGPRDHTRTTWDDDAPVSVTIGGVDAERVSDSSWTPGFIEVNLPDSLGPGIHDVDIETAWGHTVTATAEVLSWGQVHLDRDSFDQDHEGTMSAFMSEIVVAQDQGVASFAELTGFTAGRPQFNGVVAGDSSLPGIQFDPCTRPRVMAVAFRESVGDPTPTIQIGRRGGAGTDDGTGRDCTFWDDPHMASIGFSAEVPGGGGGSGQIQTPSGTVPFVAGAARYLFDVVWGLDHPDPPARVNSIPVVAIYDASTDSTELLQTYGGTIEPLLDAPLAGRGTLHEAGNTIYFAGGEADWSGDIYEIPWREAAVVPMPVDGLDPERVPIFSASPDGDLWAIAVLEDGTIALHRWAGNGGPWSHVTDIPSGTPGTNAAGLADNPERLGVNDLAIYHGRPVIAAHERSDAGSSCT